MFKAVFVIYACIFYVSAVDFPANSRVMKFLPKGTNFDMISSIEASTKLAKVYCQQVFKWDRWNCPESAFLTRKHPITKEFAYIQAIISASLLYTVTKRCSSGELEGCGCDPRYRGRYSDYVPSTEVADVAVSTLESTDESVGLDKAWGGCSDDVKTADRIVKKILEKNEEYDVQGFVDVHNTNIGRQVVKKSLVKRCKCHGASGSCILQTCWHQLVSFVEIAKDIKELYHRAERINAEKFTGNLSGRRTDTSEYPKVLIYISDSPDYCLANSTSGWAGTRGRSCSKSKEKNIDRDERTSCRHLCRACGYRVRKSRREIKTKCNCKFIWCCEVTCDTCTDVTEEYFCK